MTTEDILLLVNAERNRQETLKKEGKFLFSCADKGLSEAEKLAVLGEEFGEAATEVNELVIEMSKLMKFRMEPNARTGGIERCIAEYQKRMAKELIQVAAVAVAWCEALNGDTSQP